MLEMSCSSKSALRYTIQSLPSASPNLYNAARSKIKWHADAQSQNLKDLPPLNHYLAFCKLGIRWPHNGETLYIRPGQTDKYCGDIMAYYSSWVEHPREANKDFCTRNKIAKEIFKSQTLVPSVETSPGKRDLGIHHKCRKWLAHEEKHGQKIVVPQELITASNNQIAKAKFEGVENVPSDKTEVVRRNVVFVTGALDEGSKSAAVVAEESVEQVIVDLYEEATLTEHLMPTTLRTQSALPTGVVEMTRAKK